MTRLYLVKAEGGDLLGWGPNDHAFLRRLEAGECIECETRKARNPGHHDKFFALFTRAYKTQNVYPHPKPFMVALKLRAHWYDEYVTHDGQIAYVPKSISWAQMGQEEFERFYAEAVVALAQMCSDEQVKAEADEILARGMPHEHEQLSA